MDWGAWGGAPPAAMLSAEEFMAAGFSSDLLAPSVPSTQLPTQESKSGEDNSRRGQLKPQKLSFLENPEHRELVNGLLSDDPVAAASLFLDKFGCAEPSEPPSPRREVSEVYSEAEMLREEIASLVKHVSETIENDDVDDDVQDRTLALQTRLQSLIKMVGDEDGSEADSLKEKQSQGNFLGSELNESAINQNETSTILDLVNIEYEKDDECSRMAYLGQASSEGLCEGKGVLWWNDGARYMGEWKDDKPCGYGIESYADGSFYKGEFFQDARSGVGVFCRSDGMAYCGTWAGGDLIGLGFTGTLGCGGTDFAAVSAYRGTVAKIQYIEPVQMQRVGVDIAEAMAQAERCAEEARNLALSSATGALRFHQHLTTPVQTHPFNPPDLSQSQQDKADVAYDVLPHRSASPETVADSNAGTGSRPASSGRAGMLQDSPSAVSREGSPPQSKSRPVSSYKDRRRSTPVELDIWKRVERLEKHFGLNGRPASAKTRIEDKGEVLVADEVMGEEGKTVSAGNVLEIEKGVGAVLRAVCDVVAAGVGARIRPRTWLTDRPVAERPSELNEERSMTTNDDADLAALGIEDLPKASETAHVEVSAEPEPKKEETAELETQLETQEAILEPAEAPGSVEQQQVETGESGIVDLPQSESEVPESDLEAMPGSDKWIEDILAVAQAEATGIEEPVTTELETVALPEQPSSRETLLDEGEPDREVFQAASLDEKSGNVVGESTGEVTISVPAVEGSDKAPEPVVEVSDKQIGEDMAGSGEQTEPGFGDLGVQRSNSEKIWPSTMSGTTNTVQIGTLERVNSEKIWPTTSSGQTADSESKEGGTEVEQVEEEATGNVAARVDSGVPEDYGEDWENGDDEEEIAEAVPVPVPEAHALRTGHAVSPVADRNDVHRRHSTVVENSFEVLDDDDETAEAVADDAAPEIVEQEQIQGEQERRSSAAGTEVLDQGTEDQREAMVDTTGQVDEELRGRDREGEAVADSRTAIVTEGPERADENASAQHRSAQAMTDHEAADEDAATATQPQTAWKKAPWLSFKQKKKTEPLQDSQSDELSLGKEERLEQHFGLDGQSSLETSEDREEESSARDPTTSQPASSLEDENDAARPDVADAAASAEPRRADQVPAQKGEHVGGSAAPMASAEGEISPAREQKTAMPAEPDVAPSPPRRAPPLMMPAADDAESSDAAPKGVMGGHVLPAPPTPGKPPPGMIPPLPLPRQPGSAQAFVQASDVHAAEDRSRPPAANTMDSEASSTPRSSTPRTSGRTPRAAVQSPRSGGGPVAESVSLGEAAGRLISKFSAGFGVAKGELADFVMTLADDKKRTCLVGWMNGLNGDKWEEIVGATEVAAIRQLGKGRGARDYVLQEVRGWLLDQRSPSGFEKDDDEPDTGWGSMGKGLQVLVGGAFEIACQMKRGGQAAAGLSYDVMSVRGVVLHLYVEVCWRMWRREAKEREGESRAKYLKSNKRGGFDTLARINRHGAGSGNAIHGDDMKPTPPLASTPRPRPLKRFKAPSGGERPFSASADARKGASSLEHANIMVQSGNARLDLGWESVLSGIQTVREGLRMCGFESVADAWAWFDTDRQNVISSRRLEEGLGQLGIHGVDARSILAVWGQGWEGTHGLSDLKFVRIFDFQNEYSSDSKGVQLQGQPAIQVLDGSMMRQKLIVKAMQPHVQYVTHMDGVGKGSGTVAGPHYVRGRSSQRIKGSTIATSSSRPYAAWNVEHGMTVSRSTCEICKLNHGNMLEGEEEGQEGTIAVMGMIMSVLDREFQRKMMWSNGRAQLPESARGVPGSDDLGGFTWR